ncbi:hypothetical protein ACTXT7_004285 [Hymenolepis weldensis]
MGKHLKKRKNKSPARCPTREEDNNRAKSIAGVGRSGTLMTARFVLEGLRTNAQKVDIIGTIMAIRKYRAGLVQTLAQLKFLFEFIYYCINEENIHLSSPVPRRHISSFMIVIDADMPIS